MYKCKVILYKSMLKEDDTSWKIKNTASEQTGFGFSLIKLYLVFLRVRGVQGGQMMIQGGQMMIQGGQFREVR